MYFSVRRLIRPIAASGSSATTSSSTGTSPHPEQDRLPRADVIPTSSSISWPRLLQVAVTVPRAGAPLAQAQGLLEGPSQGSFPPFGREEEKDEGLVGQIVAVGIGQRQRRGMEEASQGTPHADVRRRRGKTFQGALQGEQRDKVFLCEHSTFLTLFLLLHPYPWKFWGRVYLPGNGNSLFQYIGPSRRAFKSSHMHAHARLSRPDQLNWPNLKGFHFLPGHDFKTWNFRPSTSLREAKWSKAPNLTFKGSSITVRPRFSWNYQYCKIAEPQTCCRNSFLLPSK